jgi:hypothetical protein
MVRDEQTPHAHFASIYTLGVKKAQYQQGSNKQPRIKVMRLHPSVTTGFSSNNHQCERGRKNDVMNYYGNKKYVQGLENVRGRIGFSQYINIRIRL